MFTLTQYNTNQSTAARCRCSTDVFSWCHIFWGPHIPGATYLHKFREMLYSATLVIRLWCENGCTGLITLPQFFMHFSHDTVIDPWTRTDCSAFSGRVEMASRHWWHPIRCAFTNVRDAIVWFSLWQCETVNDNHNYDVNWLHVYLWMHGDVTIIYNLL